MVGSGAYEGANLHGTNDDRRKSRSPGPKVEGPETTLLRMAGTVPSWFRSHQGGTKCDLLDESGCLHQMSAHSSPYR